MIKYIFIILSLILLSGCAITYTQQPIRVPMGKNQICIMHNPKTRAGFERAMVDWLNEHQYRTKILSQYSNQNACKWLLTYYGKWSWDLYIYLADAKITAYHNGQYAGYSRFHVDGKSMNVNMQKYGSADLRVRAMMDNLFYGHSSD